MFFGLPFTTLFLVVSVVGAVLYAVQSLLQVAGTEDGWELDDGDAGIDGAFKVLSLQGLSAFFIMFGLSGWMFLGAFQVGIGFALIGATLVGIGTLYVLREIFALFIRLQSNGTLDIQRAEGATGTVYLSISPSKLGKVTVVVDNRQLTRDAAVVDNDTLSTGTPIVVRYVREDGILVVERQ